MRDFLIVVIVLGSVPLTLVRPQVGILMWYWISLMNPHRLSWGYAYSMRVALIVAAATCAGWLASRERKLPPATAATYCLIAIALWVTVSTAFAIVPAAAFAKWQEAEKILAMTFVAMCIVNSKERILQTVWVIVLSLVFYGIKGGVFGILTGGHYRVWGPADSFIEDNNALGLALIMILPLLHFLFIQAKSRWVRWGVLGAMGPTIVAILCTYSRGDFLALSITLFIFWLKAKRRLVTGVFAVVTFAAALAFLPTSWYDRMATVEHYEQDGSAQGRIMAWTFALRLAADRPITGGGFSVVDDSQLYFHYVPEADVVHAFHSIYFEFLGEHGYVGLALFLALIIVSLLTGQSIIHRTRRRPDLDWARQLASAIQVSIIGYCAAGTFLNLGFYDLLYALVAVLIATKVVVERETASQPRRGLHPMPPVSSAAAQPLARATLAGQVPQRQGQSYRPT